MKETDNKKEKQSKGTLFLVSTPIGHPDDITIRAVNTLKQVDSIICEEFKIGSKLLKRLDINKPLQNLNEHNEEEEIDTIIDSLKKGKTLALISDCGTPVFADPGFLLVQAAVAANIPVVPIPGASSLMSALVCSGFPLDEFYYAGFLPRKTEERQDAIKKLSNFSTVLVIYEAPYRLQSILKDLAKILGSKWPTVVCMNLTQTNERIYRGTLGELNDYFQQNKLKEEFVIIINRKNQEKKPKHSCSSGSRSKKKWG